MSLSRIACVLLCGGLTPLPGLGQSLELTSFHEWSTPSVVGVSALELDPGGVAFTALSDQGWFLTGRLLREDGAVTGVELDRLLPILGIDGRPSAARRVGDWSDAEGLVVDPAGRIWVSFERWARVETYASPTSPGTALPAHPSFASYRANRQLEALAQHPDGTLYTLSESPQDAGFALYRFDAGAWQITGHIPRSGWYAIVGADFDAKGRLFVLERRHLVGLWWQNRIRLVADVTRPDATQVLWEGALGAYDNLEGIAVWGTGPETRVTVVSDNNSADAEITQFLEFVLRE